MTDTTGQPTYSLTHEDKELIAKMGADAEAWARELQKVMPNGIDARHAAAWFHHAIAAGQRVSALEAPALDVQRSPIVWGASGFELQVLAASARAAIARLREYVGFDHNQADVDALDRVDWLLGSTVNDAGLRSADL